MPIRIPNDLPAAAALQQENIFVMQQDRAITQDIRPLEIVLLNLMPTKIVTETQLSRLLGNTPLQVRLELMHMKSHISKNVSQEHLSYFYKSLEEIKDDYILFLGRLVPEKGIKYLIEAFKNVKTTKRKAHLRKPTLVDKTMEATVKRMLPYG